VKNSFCASASTSSMIKENFIKMTASKREILISDEFVYYFFISGKQKGMNNF